MTTASSTTYTALKDIRVFEILYEYIMYRTCSIVMLIVTVYVQSTVSKVRLIVKLANKLLEDYKVSQMNIIKGRPSCAQRAASRSACHAVRSPRHRRTRTRCGPGWYRCACPMVPFGARTACGVPRWPRCRPRGRGSSRADRLRAWPTHTLGQRFSERKNSTDQLQRRHACLKHTRAVESVEYVMSARCESSALHK